MHKEFQEGRVYKFQSGEFFELEVSDQKKLPVTGEAEECVKAVRKDAAKYIGMRPELSVVASAMLLAAKDVPDLLSIIKKYGAKLYS